LSERAARPLGRVAPRELERYLSTLPFLGTLSASHARLEAGQLVELVFSYEVGGSGLADSGRFKLTYKFYSDWGDPQTEDPSGANYVTAAFLPRPCFPGESEPTVQRLRVRFDSKGHERPYQKAIIVDVVDGYVRPGDRIQIKLGDRSAGGPGTRAQTFVEEVFKLRAYVDVTGTSRLAPVPGDVTIAIVPGAPSQLQVITPRMAGRRAPLPVVARVDDAWGNPCPLPGGLARFSLLSAEGAALDRREVPWTGTGRSVRTEFSVAEPGDYRVVAEVGGPLTASASAPITVFAALPGGGPRAFFADLHVHAHDTVGTNSTAANLEFARDLAGLDVLGYTVNDFQITDKDWNSALSDLERFQEDGQFVCFAGTEWCGNSAAGGDHNVVFIGEHVRDDVRFPRDAAGDSLRSFEWHEHMHASVPVPGRWPLSRIYDAYEDAPERFLMIPHVGGRRAVLDWHHPDLERLVEISSSWGHFDWLYHEALERGYQLGASASGDEHRGRPGGGAPGASIFGVRGGLTGVLAPALHRQEIGRALRRRHTWATTGERNVALLTCAGHMQGDVFAAIEPLTFHYTLLGHRGWEHVALRSRRGVLWQRDLHQELGYSTDRVRIRWGGARVKDRYRWANWKIGIEIRHSSVTDFTPRGFEHPEERARAIGQGVFEVESATHGDADELELTLGSLPEADIVIHPTITSFDGSVSLPGDWEVHGSELLQAGVVRRDLGGVGLFVAVERMTSAPLPISLSGEVAVPLTDLDPDGDAVYLFARELGDAKVWTSPLFVRRAR
jgi:hypothetical protein